MHILPDRLNNGMGGSENDSNEETAGNISGEEEMSNEIDVVVADS